MDFILEGLAVRKFSDCYGCTPKKMGYPYIGIDEEQAIFVYGKEETVPETYRRYQKSLGWVIKFGMLLFADIGTIFILINYKKGVYLELAIVFMIMLAALTSIGIIMSFDMQKKLQGKIKILRY